jgi:hypothetical protein
MRRSAAPQPRDVLGDSCAAVGTHPAPLDGEIGFALQAFDFGTEEYASSTLGRLTKRRKHWARSDSMGLPHRRRPEKVIANAQLIGEKEPKAEA